MRVDMQARDAARAVIDRLADAYNRKDEQAIGALYHPEVTYWSALSGLHTGKDAVLAHVQSLFHELPEEQMRAVTVVTDGDTAVVEFQSTGSGPTGLPYVLDFTEVIELDAGLITSIKVYIDPVEVSAAMGG
jgi:uncharacterized protein (TIGR02246 family)